jgi:hypothetical protein
VLGTSIFSHVILLSHRFEFILASLLVNTCDLLVLLFQIDEAKMGIKLHTSSDFVSILDIITAGKSIASSQKEGHLLNNADVWKVMLEEYDFELVETLMFEIKVIKTS